MIPIFTGSLGRRVPLFYNDDMMEVIVTHDASRITIFSPFLLIIQKIQITLPEYFNNFQSL